MLVYPFIPEERNIYLLDGFDPSEKQVAPPLLVLPAKMPCPAGYCGYVFSPERGIQNTDDASDIICITSQVCGGSYSVYLQTMLRLHGKDLWLYFDPLCHVFSLPARNIPGKKLSQQDLREILSTAPCHFSSVLCCNYCILAQEAKMILFDTPQTIAEKRKIAEAAGIRFVFGWLQA